LYAEAKSDADAGSYDRRSRAWNGSRAWAPARCWPSSRSWTWPTCTGRPTRSAQALSTIERFIKYNPSSPALDYALYLRGVINFNDNLGLLGNLAGQDLAERDQRASRDAYQAFKQLIDQFPASRYAADARCAWTTSSTRWRPTKCTWRATTTTAAPTWPRPTAPSRR
jgi:outer membrane protein assembly factor BamD